MTGKRTRETAGTAQDGRGIGSLENPDGIASSTAAFAHDAALECPVPRIGEIVVPDPSTGLAARAVETADRAVSGYFLGGSARCGINRICDHGDAQ